MCTKFRTSTLFASATLVILLGWMLYFEHITSKISPGPYITELSDVQSESLQISLELVKLINNWSLAIVGATAFFLKLNIGEGFCLHRKDLIISILIIIFSVISLFFGHLAFDRAATTLALNQFPLLHSDYRSISRYQYLFNLCSIGLFGFHVFQFYWSRIDDINISGVDNE